MDDGRNTPCCQTASAEDVDLDPEMYQCEACPVIAAIDALGPKNYEAWQTFQRTCTRMVVEGNAMGTVLNKLGQDESAEAFLDRVSRFSILYDTYYPPPKAKKATKHGA